MSLKLVWTTLPRGGSSIDGQPRIRLTAFVGIEAKVSDPEATLAQVPLLLDWPATMADRPFAAAWKPQGEAARPLASVRRVTVPGLEPDSTVWKALFVPSMRIGDQVPLPEVELLTYDARRLANQVDDVMRRLCAEPGPSQSTAKEWLEHLPEWSRTDDGAASSPDPAFAELKRYLSVAPPRSKPALPDFHRIFTSAVAQGDLCFKLGLAVTLEVDFDEIGGAEGCLRLVPAFEDPSIEVRCPWTACVVRRDQGVLDVAGAEGSRYRDGLVELRGPHILSSFGSVPAAVMNVAAFRERVSRLESDLASRSPMPEAVPDVGITLHNVEARDELERARSTATARGRWFASEPSDDVVLHAEDLVRGIRVDVREGEAGVWRSLCRRAATIEVGPADAPIGIEAVSDEGVHELTPTAGNENDKMVVRVAPTLFTWNGYSLVGNPPPHEGTDPEGPIRVRTKVRPGSLERLRYGRTYQFRARWVDLAGQSLSVDAANRRVAGDSPSNPARSRLAPTASSPFVSEPVRFERPEPLKRPRIVRATPPQPGEEELVVGVAAGVSDRSAVYVLPPTVTQPVFERHGGFDDLDADGSFGRILAHRKVLPVGYDDVALRSLAITRDQIRTPDLPDPMVAGATLAGLPDRDRFGPISFAPRSGDGSLARSFRIEVRRGGSSPVAPTLDDDGHLQVPLPPGTTWEVEVRSHPTSEATYAVMGAKAVQHLEAAQPGEPDLFAPAQRLVLVHAVPQPLQPPAFATPTALRRPGETEVTLRDPGLRVEAGSTGRVIIEGTYTDRDFDASTKGYVPTTRRVVAGEATIDEACPVVDFAARHAFPDTRARRVAYRPVGITRFRDFYPDRSERQDLASEGERQSLWIPSSAVPPAPGVVSVTPAARRVASPEGRTPHFERTGGGLRVVLEHPWFASGPAERLAVVLGTGDFVTSVSANPVVPPPSAGTTPLRVLNAVDTISGVRHPNLPEPVDLALFDVQTEPETKTLFCDIAVDGPLHFTPFVRLALLRYQPHSLEGVACSAIAVAPFVAVLPSRRLELDWHQRNHVTITVSGPSDRTSDGQTSVMMAQLEYRHPAVHDDQLGWISEGDAVVLTPDLTDPEQIHWEGQIPTKRPGRIRVVVREFATFDTDASVASGVRELPRDGRLVFVEAAERLVGD